MINSHKYPFQKRLHELKGLPPIYGVITGLQDVELEQEAPAQLFQDTDMLQQNAEITDEKVVISWHMPAPQHVLEVIHTIASASQDKLSRMA